MPSPSVREASQVCLHGCCPAPFLSLVESANPRSSASATTTRASRANFVTTTTAVLFPNTYFTNHESLPSLMDAYSSFIAAYPQFRETEQVGYIREQEYHHLSNHICLDYTGFGLFSHAQLHSSEASSSSQPPPPLYSFPHLKTPYFNISYKSASLKSQVQQGSQECATETEIRKRIMRFLNILEDDYAMVCTANKTSSFKLLAESYPFQTNRRLLTVYDCENEAVSVMAESSQKRGAKVMSANFSWPSLRIHSTKMNEMIISKRKKKKKGLFVFPLQSSVTGARYSYLWMRLAQENGWHVLLDACALGPKDLDTLGLSLIQPDFLICSFFKVFGDDPSGFACLFVRRSSSSILESTTIARSIGIMKMMLVMQACPLNHRWLSHVTDLRWTMDRKTDISA
ncbi:hypothetical protein Taro_031680 [Colocasia esculenta]|uniref:Molybdenum cofactor sulfurase n=1 Tax=Colocasia esculenta TaxID=4460 RepID=A0A843VV93_COLES|nr:hypothetical protein [Colocasia esculenta]